MKRGPSRLIVAASLCFIAASAVAQPAGQNRARLYVEPFATKEGAEKFQQDLASELRKLNTISLAADASSASLILGGGGEIWIKGYRSRTPMSRSLPATYGEPIYGGYLSVELRNKRGATVWSDLVTPDVGSGDVAKDLAKLIASHLQKGLTADPRLAEGLPETSPATGAPQPAVTLNGAGATFPNAVYQKWITNFCLDHPGVQMTYDAIGSENGIRKLLAGGVDFGASDSPSVIADLAPGESGKYLLFPTVTGAVVPIVNLPGVPKDIRFTPEVLAGIYLGKITKWDDAALKQLNRGIRMPSLDIAVVHRSDGSGTSFAWTDYLSKTNVEWKAKVGAGLSPKWPLGRGAVGNDGVAQLVKETNGAIGYVEFIYALQNHIEYGRVRNRNGEFVQASLESITRATAANTPDDFAMSITDAPGPGAYPIASFTWLVVPAHVASESKRSALTGFLHWMLGPGQRQAAALAYAALPKDIVAKEDAAIAKIN